MLMIGSDATAPMMMLVLVWMLVNVADDENETDLGNIEMLPSLLLRFSDTIEPFTVSYENRERLSRIILAIILAVILANCQRVCIAQ